MSLAAADSAGLFGYTAVFARGIMAAGFRCKQFFVSHGDCALKVGTDALLLGAWARVPAEGDMLDIGAGSGILSLMLAQRSQPSQHIDAVELDPAAATQARQNVRDSPWPTRIRVTERDILTYPASADHHGRRYRSIISNPPYFADALLNPAPQKQWARHQQQLTLAALLDVAASLIEPAGHFSLILPCREAEQLCAHMRGWQLARQQPVQSVPAKAPIRTLLELIPAGADNAEPQQLPPLLIRGADGQYSAQYRGLLAGFYLNF